MLGWSLRREFCFSFLFNLTPIFGKVWTKSHARNGPKRGMATVPLNLNPYLANTPLSECWCAQQLSGISAKLDDKECNLPCDGDKSQACGGALKLTVRVTSTSYSASSWRETLT